MTDTMTATDFFIIQTNPLGPQNNRHLSLLVWNQVRLRLQRRMANIQGRRTHITTACGEGKR